MSKEKGFDPSSLNDLETARAAFRWAMEPNAEPVFLEESGFVIDATLDAPELARRTLGRANGGWNYGECLATARRS